MCGRFAIRPTPAMIGLFELQEAKATILQMESCYNVGPGFTEPIVVKNSPNHLELMRWGLVPPWAKDIRIGYKMINARAESILEKPSYKNPFRKRRCIVPITGFYEWHATDQGKIPYFIYPPDAEFWGLAGLYEVAHDAEGKEIKSFTIITCQPNDFMANIHFRMPVILPGSHFDSWLDNSKCNEGLLLHMLRPYRGAMAKREVSSRVNKVENQDNKLIEGVQE